MCPKLLNKKYRYKQMNISVYAAVLVDVTTRVTRFWRISVWVQNHWTINVEIAGFANSMLHTNTERAQQLRGEDGYPTKNLRAQPTIWNINATWYCCWFIIYITYPNKSLLYPRIMVGSIPQSFDASPFRWFSLRDSRAMRQSKSTMLFG